MSDLRHGLSRTPAARWSRSRALRPGLTQAGTDSEFTGKSQVEHRDGQSLRLSDGNLNLSPGLLSRRLAASDSSLRLESLSLMIRHAMASGQLTSGSRLKLEVTVTVRVRVESVPVNVRLADDHWHESPARRRGQAALTVTRTVTRGGF